MLDIIMPTCDKYVNITKATIHSIDTFWVNRPKIIILGYEEPNYKLPYNCEFISLGVDKTPQNWTNGLKKFFSDYNKNHFILHMDDHCVIKKIDENKVEYLSNKIINDRTIDKVMLNPFIYQGVKLIENDKIKLYSYPENGIYRTSLINAIWRVDYFKKYLNENLSPWEFEHQKNQGRFDGGNIITTDDELIMISSLMSRGEIVNKDWYDSIKKRYTFEPPTKGFENEINKILKYIN